MVRAGANWGFAPDSDSVGSKSRSNHNEPIEVALRVVRVDSSPYWLIPGTSFLKWKRMSIQRWWNSCCRMLQQRIRFWTKLECMTLNCMKCMTLNMNFWCNCKFNEWIAPALIKLCNLVNTREAPIPGTSDTSTECHGCVSNYQSV